MLRWEPLEDKCALLAPPFLFHSLFGYIAAECCYCITMWQLELHSIRVSVHLTFFLFSSLSRPSWFISTFQGKINLQPISSIIQEHDSTLWHYNSSTLMLQLNQSAFKLNLTFVECTIDLDGSILPN